MGSETETSAVGETDTNDLVEELTRPIVKLLLALVGLFVLRFIVERLPGLGTQIPGLPLSGAVVAAGVITLAMVAVLVNFGTEMEPRLQRALSGPSAVVAIRMFETLDELTDVLTNQVKSATVSTVECPGCSEEVSSSLEFCPSCGTELPVAPEPEPVDDPTCGDCGADLDPTADFCGSCGSAA